VHERCRANGRRDAATSDLVRGNPRVQTDDHARRPRLDPGVATESAAGRHHCAPLRSPGFAPNPRETSPVGHAAHVFLDEQARSPPSRRSKVGRSRENPLRQRDLSTLPDPIGRSRSCNRSSLRTGPRSRAPGKGRVLAETLDGRPDRRARTVLVITEPVADGTPVAARCPRFSSRLGRGARVCAALINMVDRRLIPTPRGGGIRPRAAREWRLSRACRAGRPRTEGDDRRGCERAQCDGGPARAARDAERVFSCSASPMISAHS